VFVTAKPGCYHMLATSTARAMATAAIEVTQGIAGSIRVVNPATRQLITSLSVSTPDQVDDAIRTAKTAFDSGVWSRAPPHKRAQVLSSLSHALRDRVAELAELESQQTGRTIREMRAQLGNLNLTHSGGFARS
jgi:acyl-CoA reductase-like NAD-dependent aldehyde dehydrogenase